MTFEPCTGLQGRGLILGLTAAFLLLGAQATRRLQYNQGDEQLHAAVANLTSAVVALQQGQERQTQLLQRAVDQLLSKQHMHRREHRLTSHPDVRSQLNHRMSVTQAPAPLQANQPAILQPHQAAILQATAQGHLGVASRAVQFRGINVLMLVLKNDEYVGAHILRSGQPWEPELLGPLMDFARPNSTVIDAGANIGAFSLFLAHKVGPMGRVYSFEPQRKVYQLLCANVMNNGLLNIVPERYALSYTAASVSMDAKVQGGGMQGVPLAKAEADPLKKVNYGGMGLGVGGEPVETRTLDSLNLTNVSLLKVDVQGAEPLLMHGAQETIKREMPAIAYEVDGSKHQLTVPPAIASFNFTDFLVGLGYKRFPGVVGANVLMLPPSRNQQ